MSSSGKCKLILRDGLIYRSRSPKFNVWHHLIVKKRQTWVWPLGWEDPLEEDMAAHSSILVWRIPGTEEPGGLQSLGSQRVTTEPAFTCFSIWKYDLPLTIITIILFPPHYPNSPCLFINFSSFNKFLKVFWLELPWIYALIYIMPL